ncbi:hypothetical protein WN944_027828 [Citrus x changshan-huyou]|uniref:Uncharacterized protein n=1 Tax=Citrus x changshan-huyou TaxID=2935761 RepID=A0AAP0Q9J6_9ROSI
MQRPPVLAGSSGPPATSVQTTSAPAAIPITSPAASQHTAVPHASALFPGIPSRPPHVSSRVSPTINHQVSRGIRAPAPHLQPFRPSTSLASTSLPSSVLPTLPSNARPTSIPLLQRPLLSPLATCNTSLYNRAPGPKTSGVVPVGEKSDHDPPPPLLLDHDPSPPRLLDHELSPMIFQVMTQVRSALDVWAPLSLPKQLARENFSLNNGEKNLILRFV